MLALFYFLLLVLLIVVLPYIVGYSVLDNEDRLLYKSEVNQKFKLISWQRVWVHGFLLTLAVLLFSAGVIQIGYLFVKLLLPSLNIPIF